MRLKQGGATYVRDRNMLQTNGKQSLGTGSNFWVRLKCECDLYAKIYGNHINTYLMLSLVSVLRTMPALPLQTLLDFVTSAKYKQMLECNIRLSLLID